MRRLLNRVIALVIVLVVLYGAYLAYLGPRLTGDAFVRALQASDSAGIQALVCQDGTLGSAALSGGALALTALGVTGGGNAENAAYTPLSGQYTFDWRLASVAGATVNQRVRLFISTASPIRFCVSDVGLVN